MHPPALQRKLAEPRYILPPQADDSIQLSYTLSLKGLSALSPNLPGDLSMPSHYVSHLGQF